MVWIHGGGFVSGSATSKWYSGAHLAARHGVIVVGVEYRLGPLGFLSSPELKRAFGESGGANGLNDQIVALRWVQRHIDSFGGDPRQVTIFGESSGGVAVCILNASPKAAGLFSRAILSSGPCIVPSQGWGPATEAFGNQLGVDLMKRLNATSIADLRGLPPQLLQWDNATLGSDNFAGYSFDGGVIPAWPETAYSSGQLNAQSMLLGHTSKDGTSAFYGKAPLANATFMEWKQAMRTRWGADAPAVMAQYSLGRFQSASDVPAVTASYIAADADNRVGCPLWRMASLVANATRAGDAAASDAAAGSAAAGSAAAARGKEQGADRGEKGTGARSPPTIDVHTFVFSHLHLACDAAFQLRALPWWLPRSDLLGSGWASHGSDNKFVFHTEHGEDSLAFPPFPQQDCTFSQAEHELSNYTGAAWAAVAATGRPPWPSFTDHATGITAAAASAGDAGGNGRTRTMVLQTADARGVAYDYKKDDCEFWAKLGGAHGHGR